MSRVQFRRGFKTQAERLSMELRAELRLGAMERLDPRALAQHLAIPVVDLSDLRASGASAAAVYHFQRVATDVVSAFTVVDGFKRLIVINDAHAPTRQASDLAHELSHVVLEHEGLVSARPGVGTFVTRTLSGESLASHRPLRRDLQRWLVKARGAGLDDESIEALFQDTFRSATQEGVA